ncbi:MAG: hypothetical protein DMC60_02660, partial [Verrucomicrobia bacterium]
PGQTFRNKPRRAAQSIRVVWLARVLGGVSFAMKIHPVLFLPKFFGRCAAAGHRHVNPCTTNGSMKSGMRYNQLP